MDWEETQTLLRGTVRYCSSSFCPSTRKSSGSFVRSLTHAPTDGLKRDKLSTLDSFGKLLLSSSSSLLVIAKLSRPYPLAWVYPQGSSKRVNCLLALKNVRQETSWLFASNKTT